MAAESRFSFMEREINPGVNYEKEKNSPLMSFPKTDIFTAWESPSRITSLRGTRIPGQQTDEENWKLKNNTISKQLTLEQDCWEN